MIIDLINDAMFGQPKPVYLNNTLVGKIEELGKINGLEVLVHRDWDTGDGKPTHIDLDYTNQETIYSATISNKGLVNLFQYHCEETDLIKKRLEHICNKYISAEGETASTD